MQVSRREFLGAAGWSVIAGATAGCQSTPVATAAPPPVLIPTDWASVRRQFDLSPDWLHLSQFFIVSGASGVGLPPQYSLFGKVVKGLDVVDQMEKVKTGPGDKPVQDLTINSVEITEAD